MKTIRKIDKTFSNIIHGGKPTIFHFRLTQNINQKDVIKCIEKLKNMREAKVPPRIFALSVNAHGGSYAQARSLRDALLQTSEDLKSIKIKHLISRAPLYTFAEDFALESGYYLLSAGHKIYANPFSLIGDIGVTTRTPKFDKIAKKYLNIISVKSGKEKASFFPWEKTSTETGEFLAKVAENFHKEMCERILDTREISMKDKGLDQSKITKEIFTGRTFTAKEAISSGLVDEITTFEEFQEKNYKDMKVVEYVLDKNERLDYRQIKSSFDNLKTFMTEDHSRPINYLESFESDEIQAKVEYAEDVLRLFQSEQFLGELKNFVSEEIFDDLKSTIQSRMSLNDMMSILDESEAIQDNLSQFARININQ